MEFGHGRSDGYHSASDFMSWNPLEKEEKEEI